MTQKGKFFAVGKPEWKKACDLGLNPACALLVLACGSGRDNKTTGWSATAVEKHLHIGWRRAHDGITTLEQHGLVTITKPGTRPVRKLSLPEDDKEWIWLPNEVITGAGNESPPVRRIREVQDIRVLRTFVNLYGEQDLVGDGGIARDLLYEHYERTKIMDLAQFTVYGFKRPETRRLSFKRALAHYDQKTPKGEQPWWDHIQLLEKMGLLERSVYLAESTAHDAELLVPLYGDAHATAVADAASEMAREGLPGGFSYEAEQYDFTLPVLPHIVNAAVVVVSRLRYRPKTAKTSVWYGKHVELCQQYAALYLRMASGDHSMPPQQQAA